MMINLNKKIIVGTTLIGLLFNPIIFAHKASAQMAVIDAGAISAITSGFATVNGSITAQTAGQTGQNTKTNTESLATKLKQFAVMLVKKLIINRIVDLTAQWIERGGFEGKGGPIVQDWNAFFRQAEEDAIGELANKYVKFLCAPFKLNAALFLTPPASSLSSNVSCSLNNIVDNIDSFFQDFEKSSNGRWIAYNTIWQPQNNYFGTILNLENEKELKLSDVKNQQNVKATVNLGFQPQVKCTKDAETGQDHCVTITPGQTIATKLIGPSTGELQTNALISSSDISNYVAVLADAIIYRYQTLAVAGLQGLLASKDKTEQQNSDLCNRCAANPNLAECATASCINSDLQSRFNLIDSLTFNNSKNLYLQDISAMLTAKNNTLLALNSAKNTENQFSSIYGNLDTCYQNILIRNENSDPTDDVLITADQQEILRNAGAMKTNVEDILTALGGRSTNIENQIFTLQGIQAQFNNYTSSETNTMDANYANLVATGRINVAGATSETTATQTEANNYSQALTNQSTTNADAGGFKDVIALCVPVLSNLSQ